MGNEIWDLYERQKADLVVRADELSKNLQIQQDKAVDYIQSQRDTAQQQINDQTRSLAEQLVGAGDALLNNQLQPIVFSPENKTPWGMVVVAAFLTYILFKP